MKANLVLLALSVSVATAGCANHVHPVVARSDSPFFRGEFVHVAPTRLTIETTQKRYEATGFVVVKTTNYAELRKRYQTAYPKHWERIASGMDSDHAVYSAKPRVRASDGDEMSCDLLWLAGQVPAGTCTDASGKAYVLAFG